MVTATDPGDIGRRVAHRRRELDLSLEDVAARAAMDPGYLEYLESQPAQPTPATLTRLAVALETTLNSLVGGGVDLPPGHDRGSRSGAPLDPLTERECRALLAPGGIGRFVFDDARGPVALPVNYRMADGDIVFRTAEVSSIRSGTDRGRVGFEVDHIDDAQRQGWSVLATGYGHEVHHADELRALEQLGVEPWAGEARPVFLRLEPAVITGRRISVAV